MTEVDLERAQKAMQQQWYDLVMAEQQGSSLEVLEQMYDSYILLAEEYNRCCHDPHALNAGACRELLSGKPGHDQTQPEVLSGISGATLLRSA
jgi:hypothetical protein